MELQKQEEVRVEWTPAMMLEVRLNEPDDFLKVKETLTRVGVANKKTKKLFQSCHILHKQGRYFIVHFKELFVLDGKPSTLTESDVQRRNTIATLLSDWGLVEIIDQKMCAEKAPLWQIKVIPHRDKANWVLEAKYDIGSAKR